MFSVEEKTVVEGIFVEIDATVVEVEGLRNWVIFGNEATLSMIFLEVEKIGFFGSLTIVEVGVVITGSV